VYGPGGSTSIGSTVTTSGKELDLRVEMDGILDGAIDEIAKGRTGLLRKMRRDSNGDPIKCACVDKITDEADLDYYCRSCLGMSYYWDEYEVTYYRDDNSMQKLDGKDKEYAFDSFYIKYNNDITELDYVIIVEMDENGDIVSPVNRQSFFKIRMATPFRCDEGRIEYWRLRAIEERKWSVHYGKSHRQYP